VYVQNASGSLAATFYPFPYPVVSPTERRGDDNNNNLCIGVADKRYTRARARDGNPPTVFNPLRVFIERKSPQGHEHFRRTHARRRIRHPRTIPSNAHIFTRTRSGFGRRRFCYCRDFVDKNDR